MNIAVVIESSDTSIISVLTWNVSISMSNLRKGSKYRESKQSRKPEKYDCIQTNPNSVHSDVSEVCGMLMNSVMQRSVAEIVVLICCFTTHNDTWNLSELPYLHHPRYSLCTTSELACFSRLLSLRRLLEVFLHTRPKRPTFNVHCALCNQILYWVGRLFS